MAKAFLSKYLHSIIDHTGIPGVGGGGEFLPLSGGTLTGDVLMSGNYSISGSPNSWSQMGTVYWGDTSEWGELIYSNAGDGTIYVQASEDKHNVTMGGTNMYIYIHGASGSDPNKMEFGARAHDWWVDDYSLCAMTLTSAGELQGQSATFDQISATTYLNSPAGGDPSTWSNYPATATISGAGASDQIVVSGHIVPVDETWQLGSGGPGGNAWADIITLELTTYTIDAPQTTATIPHIWLTRSIVPSSTDQVFLGNATTGFQGVYATSAIIDTVSATNYIGVASTPSAWADYEATSEVSASSGLYAESHIDLTSAWTTNVDASGSMVFSYNG